MIVPRDPSEPITAEMWDQLRARWPDGQRLAVAMRLALDVDALADLLAGYTVHPDALNQDELLKARRTALVRLVKPIDLLAVGDG